MSDDVDECTERRCLPLPTSSHEHWDTLGCNVLACRYQDSSFQVPSTTLPSVAEAPIFFPETRVWKYPPPVAIWASFSHGKNIYRKEPAPVQWSPPGSHEGESAGPGKCSHKSLNLEQQLTEQTCDSMSSNTWRDRFQGLLTPGRLQNAAEALGARSRNRRCGIAGFSFEVAARLLFIEFLVGLLGNRKPQVRGPAEVG